MNSSIQHFIQLFLSKEASSTVAPFSFFRVLLYVEDIEINPPHFQCQRKTLTKFIKGSNLLIRTLTIVCQFKHAGSDKQQKIKSWVFTSVFQILDFHRTLSTYFHDVLFYSNYFCLLTAFLLDNLDVTYFTRKSS